jgi:hypothetical protein
LVQALQEKVVGFNYVLFKILCSYMSVLNFKIRGRSDFSFRELVHREKWRTLICFTTMLKSPCDCPDLRTILKEVSFILSSLLDIIS